MYATLTVPAAILEESFLSFLGLGVQAPMPSWGNLASDATAALNPVKTHWMLVIWPLLARKRYTIVPQLCRRRLAQCAGPEIEMNAAACVAYDSVCSLLEQPRRRQHTMRRPGIMRMVRHVLTWSPDETENPDRNFGGAGDYCAGAHRGDRAVAISRVAASTAGKPSNAGGRRGSGIGAIDPGDSKLG